MRMDYRNVAMVVFYSYAKYEPLSHSQAATTTIDSTDTG